MTQLDEQLSRWRGAGLLTPSQAEAIREYEKLTSPQGGEVPDAKGGGGWGHGEPQGAPEKTSSPPPSPPPPRAEGGMRRPGVHLPGTRSLAAAGIKLPTLDARLLGGILAALALLAMIGAIFALATDVVVAPSHRLGTDLEDVVHAVAAGLGLAGGLRMAGGSRDGRRLVLVSLGLNLAATLVFSISHLFEATTLLPVVAWLVLGWLTWNATFPLTPVATRSQVG